MRERSCALNRGRRHHRTRDWRASNRHVFSACSYPGVSAASSLTRWAPFRQSRPRPARWVGGLECHEWPPHKPDAVSREPGTVQKDLPGRGGSRHFQFGTAERVPGGRASCPRSWCSRTALFALGVAEGAISDLAEMAQTGFKQMFMITPLMETEGGLWRGSMSSSRRHARCLRRKSPVSGKILCARPRRTCPEWRSRCKTAIWINSACLRVTAVVVPSAGRRAK